MRSIFRNQYAFTVDMNDTCGKAFYDGFKNNMKGLAAKWAQLDEEDITGTGMKTVYFTTWKSVKNFMKVRLDLAKEYDWIKSYQII